MIALWMLYALSVGVLVAAAGRVAEEVLRLMRLPVRWAWTGALIALIGLVALAPLRSDAPTEQRTPAVAALAGAAPAPIAAPAAGWQRRLAEARNQVYAVVAMPVRAAAAVGAGPMRQRLAVGWAALSLLLLLLLAAATVLRSRRLRRRWPLTEIADTRVRVARDSGPAVLGILHPEIVVPEWLLACSAAEQRLVVLHEGEHVRARDSLLLAGGCLAVVLIPWNPAAWWMLLRLRTAVELDCDARVLRHGADTASYGSLLIEVAGHGLGFAPGIAAFAASPTTLERRIRTMTTQPPRHPAARASALAVLALAALAAACESRIPTAPEIEAMDVASAEAQVIKFRAFDQSSAITTYFVDDKPVTAEEARALTGNRITEIQIKGRTDPSSEGTREIRIYTSAGKVSTVVDRQVQTKVRIVSTADMAQLSRPIFEIREANGTRTRTAALPGQAFEGLIVINGMTVEESAFRDINPDQIEKVEILKGPAAARQYNDPRAANGVIRITTKPGATKP